MRGQQDDLAAELQAFGDGYFPATPDLSADVGASLRQRRDRDAFSRRRATPRRILAVAATIALLLVATIAAIPDTRESVAGWLGIRGVLITTEMTATPDPIPSAQHLQLGPGYELDEARRQVEYTPLGLPEELLGPPNEVRVTSSIPGGQIAYLYETGNDLPETEIAGIGLLLTQFRAELVTFNAGKGVNPEETTVEEMTVNGERAIWIEGAPHSVEFSYTAAGPESEMETIRLAGNVLLWEHGDLTMRLEAEISRERAIEIAESLEPLD